MFRRSLLAVFAVCLVAGSFGCSKDSTNGVATGTVNVRMTDAPAAVEAVHLVINEVSINSSAGDGGQWEVLGDDSLNIDLLTLQNGVFTALAVGDVPAGVYRQMRLKLGVGSTVTVDGVVHPLVVPSGLQSGYKIIGQFTVPEGGSVVMLLDFDAAKSIHQTGSGTWMLQPTVRLLEQSQAGAISGQLTPTGVETSVYAIVATDTLQRTVAATNGSFLLSMLPGGIYSVAFDPADGYRDTTLTGVVVTNGQTKSVGTVQLTAEAP